MKPSTRVGQTWLGLCVLLVGFVLAGCNRSPDPADGGGSKNKSNDGSTKQPAATTSGATITADPNPVPPGTGSGTVTIKWTTGDKQDGEVYVTTNNKPEE